MTIGYSGGMSTSLDSGERYHTIRNFGVPRSPILGEVVVVHGEHCPRSLWKLGRVIDVITGNDGQVQAAVVKVTTNGSQ